MTRRRCHEHRWWCGIHAPPLGFGRLFEHYKQFAIKRLGRCSADGRRGSLGGRTESVSVLVLRVHAAARPCAAGHRVPSPAGARYGSPARWAAELPSSPGLPRLINPLSAMAAAALVDSLMTGGTVYNVTALAVTDATLRPVTLVARRSCALSMCLRVERFHCYLDNRYRCNDTQRVAQNRSECRPGLSPDQRGKR
ncbi:hypothetical protein SKAU_G00053830 [Synaphobranchus kaupii]|uniref:Uncharacterized protein n=1 Tax=Synaphobranchus kaupii TaxID=118154 RepID=A0A9Q1G4E5_SYNKA|nr:hypothetical protein SKAU_G00053830 [Synaphobranchus kaupii]